MGLFQAFNISASGMTAERFRTDIIAQNIANVNTTSTKEGTPYRRKIVTFSEKNVTPFSQIYSSSKKAAVGNGVKVSSVTSDYSTDFIKEYDPSNPDADADGCGISLSLNKKSDGYKTYGEDLSAKKNVILADITDIIGDYTMEQYNTDKSAVHDKILKTLQKKFGADYIVDVNIVSSLTQ